MKFTKILVLLAAISIFALGSCGSSGESNDSREDTSNEDTEQQTEDVAISSSSGTSSSSDEASEYDPDPTDINYDYLDAGIPAGFPDVIPVYDSANTTVLGGLEQNAGGTMVYSLVLGCNDQISDVTNTVVGSLENIDMNMAVEGSTMLMGYMGDWDYVITIDNGEADGYTTIVTYTLTEKQ
ncbi:MAG: hypothetical protein K8R76_03290 [Candidatus Aegiribacteria sp.]|nr:hypothetical protein [Candidatus Aegiribacteria sp.]